MCIGCEICNWIFAVLLVAFIGVVLWKVLVIHRGKHGSVTLWRVATDEEFWFKHDRQLFVVAFVAPLLWFSFLAALRYVICTGTRFAVIGMFSGMRSTGAAIVNSSINQHHNYESSSSSISTPIGQAPPPPPPRTMQQSYV